MEMKWLEIAIDTTAEEVDHLAARLTMNGVTGLVLEDEEDFKQFLEYNRQYWDYVDEELLDAMKGVCRVKFYVTDDDDGQAQLKKWMEGIAAPYTAAPLGENDWATSWQKYYKPLAVGEKLYIVPEWEREKAAQSDKVPVYLNPGLTFGTGSHASTQMCLAGLEQVVEPGDSVLDLGCGSGILSIAALVLGGDHAVGVDIDPKAVDVAYENAELNGIGKDRYTVRAGDVIGDKVLVAELAQEKYKGGAAIRIIEDGMVIFAFKMPGSCEENDWWMNKKLAVSRMTETSSLRAYVESRAGLREAEWEAREDNFAACGGCFPVFRKDGKKPIHHVMVSGLHHHEDHQIIADAMSRQLGIEVPSIIR